MTCKAYPCSGVIGAAGGEIEVLAEHSKFVVPAGALSSTYTFTLSRYDAPPVTTRTAISSARGVAYSPTTPVPAFDPDAKIVFYDLTLPGGTAVVQVYTSSNVTTPVVGPSGWIPVPTTISRGIVYGDVADLGKKYFCVMYYTP